MGIRDFPTTTPVLHPGTPLPPHLPRRYRHCLTFQITSDSGGRVSNLPRSISPLLKITSPPLSSTDSSPNPKCHATCTTQVTQFHDLKNLSPSWTIKCKTYEASGPCPPDSQNEVPLPHRRADPLPEHCLWSSKWCLTTWDECRPGTVVTA